MAITWTGEITPLNVANYEVSITAIRVDDVDPTNPRTYTVPKARIETAGEKSAVADELWAMHEAALAAETAITNFVSALEASLKTNLEARE